MKILLRRQRPTIMAVAACLVWLCSAALPALAGENQKTAGLEHGAQAPASCMAVLAIDDLAAILRPVLSSYEESAAKDPPAERFWTKLRNQGKAMRTKRHQQAEERAQKTAVKLMIPLVLFIFPAMGIVLAGPAGIRLMEAFSK